MAAFSDNDDDLPESLSFSTGKKEAVTQFQQSVKAAVARKHQASLRRTKLQQRNIQQKSHKEEALKGYFSECERSNGTIVQNNLQATECTVFDVSTIDTQVARSKQLAGDASKFRSKHLGGKRNRRETAKSWLNKRLKQNVGRQQPT